MAKIKKDKESPKVKNTAKKKPASKPAQVRLLKKPQAASGIDNKSAKKQKQATKNVSGKKIIPKVIITKSSKSAFIAPAETKTSSATIIPLKEEAVIPHILATRRIKKPGVEQVLSQETHVVSKEKKIIPKKEEKPTIEHKPIAEKQAPLAEEKITIKPHLTEEAIAIKPAALTKTLELALPITLKDLAVKLQEKPSVLIQSLMKEGLMVGINQALDEQAAAKVCAKYHYEVKKAPGKEEMALRMHQEIDNPELLRSRSPIVTFMGHVDHGKTSLLDAIRKTKVVESEHGGITQHIGAYRVILSHGEITFLDTPGHEAFTAMRARGASLTDIVVLIVAADDGIMPQTQEAIDHARAAGVTIIVALNKIDKPQANVDRVKKQLSEVGLTPEDWDGKTITVPVSAKTGQGIDELLEMLLLEAQMLELKANPNRSAKGVVVEAKMTKGKGPVATLLIQNGTLRLNENIIVGKYYGKIRAMFNDRGHSITEAGPSFPVEILGLSNVPQAGEQFFVVEDEKTARDLALMRQEEDRIEQVKAVRRINLEDLHTQIKEGKLKELKLVIKADVQGSLEAIKDTLNKMNVSEIKLSVIHEAAGNINSSDVILAAASNALVLGFNVVSDDRAKELAAQEGVDVRAYNIIYELANDIKAALEGMLEPKLKKVFLGKIEVRKVFKLSRSGIVAGCFVSKGKVNRSALVDLVRNGEAVFEGKISSLKRFKDDVREVLEGFECGITIAGFDDLKEGDIIEAYDIEKIARKL